MEDKKGCLLIGEGVKITGNITLPGTVYVYGEVDGEIVSHEIYVGETGKVTGDVKVDLADIKGELLNSIQAKDSLILRATGKISGVINYQTLEIEHGGMLDGKIEKIASGKVLTMPVAAGAESK
jgi:cytoskeletal protein CcmA (bactofilin family)